MNSIVHFELPVKDKERSKKFYKEVFGWEFMDMPEMDYTMVHTVEVDEQYMPKKAGAINGGMLSEKNNGGLNPVLVIDVPSLDEYLDKAIAAGATLVMPKVAVGDMGFNARIKDTEGVVIGIWQSLNKN